MTFGADGSSQEEIYSTVQDIQQAGFKAVPHVSCVGSIRENIFKFLSQYKKLVLDELLPYAEIFYRQKRKK